MKTLIRLFYVSLVIFSVTGLNSCNKDSGDNAIGTAEFSISMPDGLSQLKSVSVDSAIVSYQLMISVEDMNGLPVFSDKLIPLYTFGTGFVSEKVEIRAGEFRLTKFMVINPSGEVIFASPLAGSPLAYLTNKPLPFKFNIYPDKVTQVLPEVLSVEGQSPDKFGYVSFGVKVIKPLTFYTMCVLDPGNPMIMAPIQITNAKLTVFANNGWRYTFMLKPEINKLIIQGGSEYYKFLLEKEGFPSQTLQFSAAKLLASTSENPLILKFNWDSQYKVFTLQPGPEAGKDAMISNLEPEKNFGGHKYFEATFMSEPVLTVMRLNRSLIEFKLPQTFAPIFIKKVMLRLSYEVPVPWDSTIFAGTTVSNFIGGVLQQVVEHWEENGVTWNKVPKTIEINQVFIPPFIRNVNFIDVDVTRLFVQPANTDPAVYPNYGMLFKLVPENKWPGFRFASSDHLNASLRPRLTIYYTNN